MNDEIELKYKPKPLDEMNNYELSRWAALVEAVNIIQEKAEDKKVPLEKISIKSLAVKKYIDGTCDIICRRMNEEDEKQRNNLVRKLRGIKERSMVNETV